MPVAGDPEPGPSKPLEPAQIAETLEMHHASERGDRAWTDQVRGELDRALGAQPSATTVDSVQCGTSLCKVRVVHETAEAQRQLATIVSSLPALSPGVYYHHEDGADPPRTVLYVVREGHDIREMLAAR